MGRLRTRALATLRGAARRLDRIAPEHPLLAEALAALDRAVIEAGEAEDKLAAAAEALTHDPRRARPHRDPPVRAARAGPQAPLRSRRAAGEDARDARALDAIEAGDARDRRAGAAERAAHDAYRARAEALHATAPPRRCGSTRRSRRNSRRSSSTPRASAPRVDRTARGALGPARHGRVEFLISTNPGADFAPLDKIASGGELSRFILALKVALAEQGGAATVIFDEIDRGVGGAVASAIGERLARLAEGGQLLVVTHSPAGRGARRARIM